MHETDSAEPESSYTKNLWTPAFAGVTATILLLF